MSQKKFLKNSALFCIGNAFVILQNYVLIILFARIFSEQDFGEVNVLLAVFTWILTLGMGISVSMTHFVSKLDQHPHESKALYHYLEKKIFLFGILIFFLFTVLDPLLQVFFHIYKPWIFSLLGVVFFSAFLLPLSRGFLRGKRDFPFVAWNSNVEALSKCAIFIAFWYFGQPFYGLIIALAGSIVISFWRNSIKIEEKYGKYNTSEKEIFTHVKKHIQPFIKYIPKVIAGTLFVTAFYTLDILIVQHLNPQLTAGYSIISKMAQILFLMSHSVIMVLFPEIASKTEARKHIGMTLGLIAFMSFSCFIGYTFLGKLAVQILFGNTYIYIVPYLSYSVILGFFLSIINFTVHCALGKNKNTFLLILAGGLISMPIILPHATHSLESLLMAMCTIIALTAITTFIATFAMRISFKNLFQSFKPKTLPKT